MSASQVNVKQNDSAPVNANAGNKKTVGSNVKDDNKRSTNTGQMDTRSDTNTTSRAMTTSGDQQLQSQPSDDRRIRIGGGNFGNWGLIPSLHDMDPFGMWSLSPFSSFFGGGDDWFERQSTALSQMRQPTMDFDETDKTYDLTVDLPGLTKDNVKINLEGRVLTVSTEYKEEEKQKGRYRRQYGTFSRSLVLPDDAIGEKINAKMEHGQLKVCIPKQEVDRRQRAITVE